MLEPLHGFAQPQILGEVRKQLSLRFGLQTTSNLITRAYWNLAAQDKHGIWCEQRTNHIHPTHYGSQVRVIVIVHWRIERDPYELCTENGRLRLGGKLQSSGAQARGD